MLEREVLVRLSTVPAVAVGPKAETDTHHFFPLLPFLDSLFSPLAFLFVPVACIAGCPRFLSLWHVNP